MGGSSSNGLGVDRRLVALLSVACGATVANLYYAQPLLAQIGSAFGVSDGTAGVLIVVVQVFYALGLVLIVPLGDLLHRRALVARLLLVCTVGLAIAAAAPVYGVLALGLAVAALTSVAVQILLPFASAIAPEEHRGAVVGRVMGGLLTGILLARTFSGLLGGLTTWRVPFAAAAAFMVVIALALWRALPDAAPPATLPYPRLLASVGQLIAREPALRRRMVYGALGFASFTLVWTELAFLLSRAPFHYHDEVIGLFGLAGLVGALGAGRMGRLADRGRGRWGTGAAIGLVLISWLLLVLGERSVPAIVAGLIAIDFGVQGQNVLSQHVIYGLGREHASRVTTAYVSSNFIGGAIGTAIGSVAWTLGGWRAVCAVGGALAAASLLFWLTEAVPARRRTAPSPSGD